MDPSWQLASSRVYASLRFSGVGSVDQNRKQESYYGQREGCASVH